MEPVIETIDLFTLASGDRLSLQTYKFIGSRPGRKTYIQANLHGAEIVGNEVIYQLMRFLQAMDSRQLAGEICLVPVCNPLGVNQRSHFFSTGRFNSYDGSNWNRIFGDCAGEKPDLESFARANLELSPDAVRQDYLAAIQTELARQKRLADSSRGSSQVQTYALALQSLSFDANYLIDIHSATIKAIDYLYCFPSREGSAPYFLLDRAVLLDECDGSAFDEAFIKPWLALENQLASLGRNIKFEVESWTLELGSGMKSNPDSVRKGIAGIKNYLAHKGTLNLPVAPPSQSLKFVPKNELKSYYAPTGGLVQNRVAIGTEVHRGERLYQILTFNKQGRLPTIIEVNSEERGLVFDASSNETVNQGEYVLGIFPHV